MKRILIATIAAISLAACSDSDNAVVVLEQQGYTDVVITGYAPFMCGKEDTYSTGFEAKSPGGQKVSGAVCSAWLKGSTIRFN